MEDKERNVVIEAYRALKSEIKSELNLYNVNGYTIPSKTRKSIEDNLSERYFAKLRESKIQFTRTTYSDFEEMESVIKELNEALSRSLNGESIRELDHLRVRAEKFIKDE